jgi:hypothetical protein
MKIMTKTVQKDVTIYGKFIEAKSGEFDDDSGKSVVYANVRALIGNREIKFKSDLKASDFKECEEGDGVILYCSLKPNSKQVAALVVVDFEKDVK